MLKSERANNRSMGSSDRRHRSRRRFLRNATVLSAGALTGLTLLEACSSGKAAPTAAATSFPEGAEASPTPAPATKNPSAWMQAFRERKSASGFQPQPLPAQLLLDLLWAAWGVNRPDSGKRTAPSAMNAQEMDIYVLLADGAYVYDAQANKLAPVVAQDLRAKTGALRDAPAHLVYVADYDRLSRAPQSQKELYSAAHSGFIGQNVYLFCALAGLGARFYAGFDRAALTSSLKLRANQAVIFAQAVGYAR